MSMRHFPGLPSVWTPGQPIAPSVVYFDDFTNVWMAVDAALTDESNPTGTFSESADEGEWLVTSDATGTIVVSDAEPGGVITVTTGSSANDFMSCQLNGQSFAMNAAKDLIFEIRCKFGDADDTQWFVGLATTDVTGTGLGPILDGTNDSIGFRQNADTGVDIDCLTEDDTNETETDSTIDVADDTFVTLTFHVRGTSAVAFYVNGTLRATHTTNIPDSATALTPTFEIHSPTASSTIEIDYIYCGQAR